MNETVNSQLNVTYRLEKSTYDRISNIVNSSLILAGVELRVKGIKLLDPNSIIYSIKYRDGVNIVNFLISRDMLGSIFQFDVVHYSNEYLEYSIRRFLGFKAVIEITRLTSVKQLLVLESRVFIHGSPAIIYINFADKFSIGAQVYRNVQRDLSKSKLNYMIKVCDIDLSADDFRRIKSGAMIYIGSLNSIDRECVQL